MARKNQTPPDPRILAAGVLAGSLADPAPKVLFGTAKLPGFFQGTSAAVKQLAEFCVREKWLEDTGSKTGTAKSAKSLYRLTDSGKQAILSHNPVSRTLEGFLAAAKALKEDADQTLGRIEAEMARLSHALDCQARVVREFSSQATPERIASQLIPGSSSTAARPEASLKVTNASQQITEEIAGKLKGRDFSHAVTLHDLFQNLQKTWPHLTIGQFHDCLRGLKREGRICLAPFTRALTFVAQEAEPLYLGGEVMYYAYGG